MTKEEEDEVHRLVQSVGVVQLSRVMFKDMDVSEMINVIILAGRGYSVKLLTWFKYYCEVMPLFIMLFHIACMVTFASHEKEMCVWFKENWVSAAFIYFSVYIHPLVLILASRFFWLCYRWRIPMIIYLFGINAIHIVYWNVFTTNEMVESNVVTSNPQPIGFSGILLAKRQNSFYCTYFLHNRNVADTKSPYPIKRLEVIRWFNQKSMVFNQSLS